MKILFIDGHFTSNKQVCIRKNGKNILGEYVNYRTTYYKTRKCEVVTRRNTRKMIRVIRQKSKWKTFMVLCHELAHWLFDVLLPHKLRDKLDDWLDRD